MDNPSFDEMHVVEPRAAGIDVHKLQMTVTLRLCEPGQSLPVAITRTFPTHPSGLRNMVGWLGEHKVAAATMEGTGIYWEPPFRALQEAGVRARLVHAQHVRQLKGRKTDVSDSIWLARVCQFELVQASFVPSREFSELRQMCRFRRKLVQDGARLRQRIHKIIDRAGLPLGGVLSDIFGVNGRIILDGLIAGRTAAQMLGELTHHVRSKIERLALTLEAKLDAHSVWRLRGLLDDHDGIKERIEDLDDRVERSLEEYRHELNLLETIPGIGRPTAHAILAEVGPHPARTFGSAMRLASWAGLCPGSNESAGKRRSGHTRRGNATLRTSLCECAHAAGRTKDSQFSAYHKAQTARIGFKKATMATAHKLLRVAYAVLRDKAPYKDPNIDYENLFVKRNSARWLRMLDKHGFLKEITAASAAAH